MSDSVAPVVVTGEVAATILAAADLVVAAETTSVWTGGVLRVRQDTPVWVSAWDGISGFAYYYYWTDGARFCETSEEVLATDG